MEGPLPPSPDQESTGAESGAMNSIRVTITNTMELLLTTREEDTGTDTIRVMATPPLVSIWPLVSSLPPSIILPPPSITATKFW